MATSCATTPNSAEWRARAACACRATPTCSTARRLRQPARGQRHVPEPKYQIQRERPARGGAERIEFAREHIPPDGARSPPASPAGMTGSSRRPRSSSTTKRRREAQTIRGCVSSTHDARLPLRSAFRSRTAGESGMLAPYYSQTSQRGLEIGMPYYWNIAPEQRRHVTPVYMARRGVQLKTDKRYLSPLRRRAALETCPTTRYSARRAPASPGCTRSSLGRGLTAQVDYNRVSDDQYFVDLASQVSRSRGQPAAGRVRT